MAEAVLFDKHLLVSAASKITSQYGVTQPIFLGVPTVLGRYGVEKIIEMPLTNEEKDNLKISINAVVEQINDLKRLELCPADLTQPDDVLARFGAQ